MSGETTQAGLGNWETYNPLDAVPLPDRDGYGWADEETTLRGGLSAVRADTGASSEYLSLNGDCAIPAKQVYYVIEDDAAIAEYIEQYGSSPLSVPQYYSRFHEFSPHLTVTTAGSGTHGYGITVRRLEAALRIATGGGRYSTSDLTVIPCGEYPFLVRTSEETFAFAVDRVTVESSPEPTDTVAGMDIPEESATIRAGIARATKVLQEQFDTTITGYRKLDHDGNHVFTTDDGRPLKLPGYICKSLAAVSLSPQDVLGTHEIETKFDETYTAEWSEIHYEIGDSPRGTDTPVVGYRFKYDDPRLGSRVSLSGRVKAYASYLMLSLREQESYLSLRRYTRDEQIGRFETENEDYDPMGSHL